MFFIKSVYCRVFQAAFRMALPVLPYREPENINSCKESGKVLKKEKSTVVLVVTDKGIVNNGWLNPVGEELKTDKIPFVVYDETLPNPTVINVEDALKLYYQNKCNAIIAIGGGSAMDCANTVIMSYVLETYGKSVYKKLYKLGLNAGICNKNEIGF